MNLTDFLQYFIVHKLNVAACTHDRGWLDIDMVDDLQCYQKMLGKAQF